MSPQGDRSPKGGNAEGGAVHESAGPAKQDAPKTPALQGTPMTQEELLELAAERLADFARDDFASTIETNWATMGDERQQYFRRAVAVVREALAASDKGEVEALREALIRTQWMLETIDRTNSTNFAEVRQRIIANREALSSLPQGAEE